MLRKVVIGSWIIVVVLLFLYSFTQVDLGLTFSRASFFLDTLKLFQYIGWFNRPLSSLLVALVYCLLFVVYCLVLWLVVKKKINTKTICVMIGVTSVILLFSYNAFSYDLFNYIFDARIFTHYHENPYQHKPLDYPEDPMLGFMHWTHRTFPYGPLWLGLTIPISFVGGGVFIVTFYLFKMLMVGSYILCSYFIYKIAKTTKLASPLLALSFFALNPFILVESLVSAHIDIVMMAAVLWGVYLLVVHKKNMSWLLLIASILIKFATILLVPIFLWYPFSKRKNKDDIFVLFAFLLMLFGVFLQSFRTTFQPWYFLLVMPFAALLMRKYILSVSSAVFSFFIFFQYIPYLYAGNYDPPIPFIMSLALWGSVGIALIVGILFTLVKKT